MKCLPHIAVLFAAVLLIASHARASRTFYVPLGTMINSAESIAIVRIEKMAAIERPKGLPHVWWPDHTVTLTVEETLRGSLAKTVTARVEINDYKNPSAKPGERALLFVGRMIPKKATGAKPKTTVDVFEAAQGFKVLADLGSMVGGFKNPKDKLNALSAIRSSIKNYKPIKGKKPYGWGPVLNDEAAKPYFDLLRSKSPAVRTWAIRAGLDYVQITPYIGTRLIKLLSDDDKQVREAAAQALISKEYAPAVSNIAHYLRSFPGEISLHDRALRYLARAAPKKYDYKGKLENFFRNADPSLQEIFSNTLKEIPRKSYVTLMLKVDEKGKITLVEHDRFLDAKVVKAFVQGLKLPKSLESDLIPFYCQLWIDREPVRVTIY